MLHTPSIVRINGVLPDLSTLGDKEKSERAAEVERTGMSTNTSCSIFVSNNATQGNQEILHLLIDAGEGVAKSLDKMDISSSPNADSIISKFFKDSVVNMPDAVLITHSHNDHIKDLPLIAPKYFERKSEALKVYCTRECHEQINNKFSDLASKTNIDNRISFTIIQPNEPFNNGPISVTPISAYHGDNAPEGSVIYARIVDIKELRDFQSKIQDLGKKGC